MPPTPTNPWLKVQDLSHGFAAVCLQTLPIFCVGLPWLMAFPNACAADLVEDCMRLDPYARPTSRDILLRLKSLSEVAGRKDGALG
jgi:hypothetical protein